MPKEYGVPKKGGDLLPWSHVEDRLSEAMVYWISTSGPGGTPRVRPLDGIYVDGTLYVGGSPETRWARDLAANPQVAVHLDGGQDVVILEGEAELLEHGVGPELAERLGRGVERQVPAVRDDGGPQDVTRYRFPADAPPSEPGSRSLRLTATT